MLRTEQTLLFRIPKRDGDRGIDFVGKNFSGSKDHRHTAGIVSSTIADGRMRLDAVITSCAPVVIVGR